MSAAKATIDAIKKLLNFSVEEPAPAPAPVDPAPAAEQEYTCADGSKVMIDKLEVGGKVMKDGQAVADGDLTLEDGKVLSVVGGLISAVTEPKPAEEPVEEPELMKAQFAAFKKEVADERIAYKELFNKQQEALTKLVELVEAIADQPSAEPLEKPVEWDSMTPLQRFRAAKTMFKTQN